MAKRRARKLTIEGFRVTVLGIDSNFEPATLAGYQYREKNVYPYMAKKGFALDKCQGVMARRIYVAPRARQSGVVYITGVGHGSYKTYTGHYYDPIFDVGNYSADEPKGKIVHLLSCETARELGPDFVRNGCRAYFGYDEDFVFSPSDSAVFFECDSEIDRAIADGLTAAKVYARVEALFRRRIADFRAQGKQYQAAQLELDFDRLRCPSSPLPGAAGSLGSVNARLA